MDRVMATLALRAAGFPKIWLPSDWSISMRISGRERPRPRTRIVRLFVAAVLLTAAQGVSATTFMSVEPIPNRDVVGRGQPHAAPQHRLSQPRTMERPAPLEMPHGRERHRDVDDPWRDHVNHQRQYPVRGRGRRVRGRNQPVVCVHCQGFRPGCRKHARRQRARQRAGLRSESGRHRRTSAPTTPRPTPSSSITRS